MTGGWTGNLRFENRIGPLGISKNIGPDTGKILRCLQEFGTGFTYLIGGYPPFILKLIDEGNRTGNFRWKDYKIHIYTSGEGFAEEWRDYVSSFLNRETAIISGYGAIDMDVGISSETHFTVALRKLIKKDMILRKELLKCERLPSFIGQYAPHKFYIRDSKNNGSAEPEITVLNLNSASPKVKYIVGDEGGTIHLKETFRILENCGYKLSLFKKEFNIPEILPFPLLYIFGRSDGTMAINGAKISPLEINSVILSNPELVSFINTFKLSIEPDENNFTRLIIYIEMCRDAAPDEAFAAECTRAIIAGLSDSNECFRRSLAKYPESSPVVKLLPYNTGIFGICEDRLKNNYLKSC